MNSLFKFFLVSIFFSTFTICANAETRLKIPEGVKSTDINNMDVYNKQSVTNKTTNQYKGKLKRKDRKEKFSIYTLRPYIGFAFNYGILSDMEVVQENVTTGVEEDRYKFSFKPEVGYAGSFGFYSPNGLKMEIEYSELNSKIDKIKKQSTGESVVKIENNNLSSSTLKTQFIMLNVILEKSSYRTKIVPYLGFGVGIMKSSMKNVGTTAGYERLEILTDENLLAGQVMIGLSYKIGNVGSVFGGYRLRGSEGSKSKDDRVSTTSVYKTNSNYMINSLDFGMRFLF